jgi:Flp pilus assembly protein TadD
MMARARLGRTAERGAAAALIAAFCVFLVHAGVDWMWEVTAIGALGLGAIAVAVAAGFERRQGAGLNAAGRIAIVALAVAAALVQFPGLVSTARVRESADALAAGDLASARRLADDAVAAQPWGAEPYVQRAAVAEAEGQFGEARADLRRAIENEPTNWRQWILLAQVELERGALASARRAFGTAKRLHPSSALYTDFEEFRRRVLGATTDATPAN